ncbi:MAG: toxin-antitoxin system HicB family antitoxin [Candidatus Bathyarchaeia archaeon]
MLPLTHPRRKRTVTLTIRTNEDVFKSLTHEAEAKKITVNTFVNQILTNHVDWGRHSSKYGSVEIPVETYAGLINLLDDETIARFGREAAQRRWKSLISLWEEGTSPESVLKFVIFWIENTRQATITLTDDGKYRRVTAFHLLGRKGSILFKNAIETMFDFVHKKVVVDIQDNQYSFKID